MDMDRRTGTNLQGQSDMRQETDGQSDKGPRKDRHESRDMYRET